MKVVRILLFCLSFGFSYQPICHGAETRIDIPVPLSATQIPSAVQQQYMSRAVDQAITEVDFTGLHGRTVVLSVAGVMPMSEIDLGQYLKQAIETKVILAGGKVDSNATDKILVQVRQAGIEGQSKYKNVKRKKNFTIPIVLGSAFAAGTISSIYASGCCGDPGNDWPLIGGLALVGTGATWGTARYIQTHDKYAVVQYYEWHAKVNLSLTFALSEMKAWEAAGQADIPLSGEFFLP